MTRVKYKIILLLNLTFMGQLLQYLYYTRKISGEGCGDDSAGYQIIPSITPAQAVLTPPSK